MKITFMCGFGHTGVPVTETISLPAGETRSKVPGPATPWPDAEYARVYEKEIKARGTNFADTAF